MPVAKDTFITSIDQIIEGDYYALPHEIRAMKAQQGDIEGMRNLLSEDIKDAMEQSSETWHDNAPADALFGELSRLDRRESRLRVAERHLTVVEYPDPSFNLVTIGSRVGCIVAGDEFEMDITGNLPLHLPSEDDVEAGSFLAPMPRALLGASVNDVVTADIGGRLIEVAVSGLNQQAQKLFYEQEGVI